MRIGIDARFYSQSGIGRYLRNLISNLQKLDKTNEYFIFLLKMDLSKFRETANFKKVLADIKWYGFSEQIKFPKLLKEYKLDLVHFPHFNVPIFYREKYIVTIHDLIHQKYNMNASTKGSLLYFLKHLAYTYTFSNAIKNSQKIITPSEYVKKDLVKTYGAKDEKIIVTYEGVEKLPVGNQKEVLEKFNIKPPFIFYIGSAHPHKNVLGLLKAFKILRGNYQYLTLVLAGKKDYFWERILDEVESDKVRDVIYTNAIEEEELEALYKSAALYVQPSFEEGFGLPILEAFSLGCPVISSHRASLPEIAGEAAEYFNPDDFSDMAEKIKKVLNNEKLKKELIEKGKIRVNDFDFSKMTKQTLDIYNSLL